MSEELWSAGVTPAGTIGGLVWAAHSAADDGVALIEGDVELTYGEWWVRSARLAGGLRASGLEPGDRIAVWLPNGIAWPVILLAAAMARLSVVGVGMQARHAEWVSLLKDARPAAILYVSRWPGADHTRVLAAAVSDVPAASGARRVALDVAYGDETPDHVPWRDLTGSPALPDEGLAADPFALVPTSGTTSQVKIAVHAQRGVAWHAGHVAAAQGLAPADAMLCVLPFAGIFGYSAFWAGVAAGARMVLEPWTSARQAARLVLRHRITCMYGSDAMYRKMIALRDAPALLRSLRRTGFACFTGSPRTLVADADERAGLTLFQVYGSSEGQALMAAWSPEDPVERRAAAGGRAQDPDLAIRVVHPEHRLPVGARVHGELEVRGRSLFTGYLGNREATLAAFTEDGFYRTGDLGFMPCPGSLVFQSRLSDAVRLHGYLTDPVEIEDILAACPGVAQAQVVSCCAEDDDVFLVAFLRPAGDGPVAEESLRAFCSRSMARYKIPRHFVWLDAFPCADGPNGRKILKAELRREARSFSRSAAIRVR